MYQKFIEAVGLAKMKDADVIVIFVMVFIACALFGFVMDLLFRRHGFGTVGNGLTLLIGFVSTAIFFNAYGKKALAFGEIAFAPWANAYNLLIAASVGSLILLVFGVAIKRAMLGDGLQ